jgi:hypothetical protein|tara:strand:+ start:238 stop:672 length:435 start_codon:yes stop_codon:yes gene_type:complete
MALSGNQLYPKGKEHLLKKQIDVTDISGTDQLKCALMSTSYTAGDGDEFFNSISGNQVGSSVALASTAVSVVGTSVTVDADNVTFSSVAAGSTVGKIVIYVAGATPGSDDYLLVYFDNDGSSISLATNGGDITVSFNASGIFAL